jgi:hypothetical protein
LPKPRPSYHHHDGITIVVAVVLVSIVVSIVVS